MSRTARLWVVLGLNLALVCALAVVGRTAHSVGVLSEAVDYLADAAAIAVSITAIHLASLPPTTRRPEGFTRATTMAALINAGWLLILCLAVSAGAVDRLLRGVRHVNGLPILIVSGTAAAAMLFGALLLLGGSEQPDAGDLNVRAVLLDTAADAAAATGVALAGAVILAVGGWYWLDPAVALLLSIVIGGHAIRLLKQTVSALSKPAQSRS